MDKVFNFLFIKVLVFVFLIFPAISFSKEFNSPEDFNNEDVFIGKIVGYDDLNDIKTFAPKSYLQYFIFYKDAIDALKNKSIDVVTADENILKNIVTDSNDEFKILNYKVSKGSYKVAISKKQGELKNDINNFIEKIKNDGTLEDMKERWILENKKEMPLIESPKEMTKKVNILINEYIPSFSFLNEDNELIGFDIELLKRWALNSNIQINFKIEDSAKNDLNTICDKIDIFLGSENVIKNKCDDVVYSNPYYDFETSFLVLNNQGDFNATEFYAEKKVGIMTGTSYESAIKKYLSKSIPVHYTATYSDQIEALKNEKIDAFMADNAVALDIVKINKELKIDSNVVMRDQYGIILGKHNEKLRDELSREIIKMKESGELLQIQRRWSSDKKQGVKYFCPPPSAKDGKKIIIAGTDTISPPFSYISNGQISGLEVDVVNRIIERLGYGIKWVPVDFASMVPAVMSGKIDFFASLVAKTPERMESVLYAESDYSGNVSLVVRDENYIDSNNAGFSKEMKKSFNKTFVREDRYKLILDGIWTTCKISFFSILLGTILGVGVCYCRRSKKKFLNYFAKGYICLFQGVPILVILMIFYYVIFASSQIGGVAVAIIVFGLNFSPYAGEMFRAGIDAVNIGQKEASLALGFSKLQAFFHILLPQALKHIIPVFKGDAVTFAKMTSIVGYISVQDLTKAGDMIRANTYEAFFPLIAIAIIYFALSYLIIASLNFIERQIDPAHRKRIIKGVKE